MSVPFDNAHNVTLITVVGNRRNESLRRYLITYCQHHLLFFFIKYLPTSCCYFLFTVLSRKLRALRKAALADCLVGVVVPSTTTTTTNEVPGLILGSSEVLLFYQEIPSCSS